MKKYLVAVTIIGLVSIATACSNQLIDTFNRVVVEERMEDSNEYQELNKFLDEKALKSVRKELKAIQWEEEAKLVMARSADYLFRLEEVTDESEAAGKDYKLWIGPQGKTIEIDHASEDKYARLNQKDSKKFYELLTDKNLNGFRKY